MKNWKMWALALGLTAMVLTATPDVVAAQDACGVNICKPDYDPFTGTNAPYSEGTSDAVIAILGVMFVVWALVNGYLWPIT